LSSITAFLLPGKAPTLCRCCYYQYASSEYHINTTTKTPGRDKLAIACALTAVAIWGWWMSATRVAATQGIAPIDVALMRYSVPALLLIPVWLSTLRTLKTAPLWATIAMLGWGAPFLWLVTESLKDTNVIYLATIVPCTMPIFAVVAERVFFAQQLTRTQLFGFALIATATLLIVFNALFGGGINLSSLGLMLLAAAGWGSYVVSFRHTGLSAAQGAAWVCAASTAIIILVKLLTGDWLCCCSFLHYCYREAGGCKSRKLWRACSSARLILCLGLAG